MNIHVYFEIAKLLKEKGFTKGFDGGQKFYYPLTKELTENHRGDNYPAPTIAEVVMWLYEKHGVWVDVSLNQLSKPTDLQWMYSIVFTQRCTYSHSPKSYTTPTAAYEAAILYVLNNLI
jgi:hypothetical protein